MYSINDLTAKAHIELIGIAKTMGITRASHYSAQELIYKILDQQAANPTPDDSAATGDEAPKPRQKRTRLKPTLLAESSNPSTGKKRGRGFPSMEAPPSRRAHSRLSRPMCPKWLTSILPVWRYLKSRTSPRCSVRQSHCSPSPH